MLAILIVGGLVVALVNGGYAPPAGAGKYLPHIRDAEQSQDLPRNLLVRVLEVESNFNPDARSPAGAVGIAQIVPQWHDVDPTDPVASIYYAARYLRRLKDRFGTWRLALAAYNWGPGNVARHGVSDAPQETRQYLDKILSRVEV